ALAPTAGSLLVLLFLLGAACSAIQMLVPLAAFDGRGHRIGYGAGYYDRAIAKLEDKGLTPRLIGIAF
ncbi:5-formyltetrahydrofolate cyclo-ligase, partial [Morganella morganii]|uniref:5-formyltetrahydrofolate cyclo-ligase n=1 Tax=Morganella morganii TaxID=582 RepID=UPI0023EB8476